MDETSERHGSEIRDQGYTIIPNVLDDERVRQGSEALDQIFSRESDVGKRHNWHNESFKVAYMLAQKHPLFRQMGLNPKLLPIIQSVLGRDCNLSNINGLTMIPGGEPQHLHLDASESTPGTCVYINAVYCLDDFNQANGGTRLIPHSQHEHWRQEKITPELESKAIYMNAPAGSVIAYDGALLHAGSRNTTDKSRRALHFFYHRSWAKPQWDQPRSFTPDVIAQMTDDEKRLFGFYSVPRLYDPVTHEIVQTL
ncbi:MAG TPA: phytanoyl-CoA dioxygenase family protein [Terriglobales bacterium]|nr:phytanoyl-CoA dioxygenase family protein [Terriglobales bacterium]